MHKEEGNKSAFGIHVGRKMGRRLYEREGDGGQVNLLHKNQVVF